jgi:hypothetical protein
MYEAFGRGDIPAILEEVDEKVEWDTECAQEGVPWLQPRHGKSGVAAFFESLAPIEYTRFEPHTFFENDDKVFVLVGIEAKHQGKTYWFPNEGHYFRFNSGGKVVKVDHVADTALHWRMANGR